MKAKYLFGLALLALAGCTADVEVNAPQVSTPDGVFSINLAGDISQEYLTRVDDGGFCDGDQIGLYGVNYNNDNADKGTLYDEGNQVDNAKYTYDEANNSWSSSGSVYYKDAETNIDLYGYYPYAHPESVTAYEFEVKQDQANNLGYAASDFLWGKVENVAPSEQRVRMTFYHRMACANVIFKEGTGFAEGEFALLTKSAMVSNTTRKAAIDLATGEVTAVGDVEQEGILMMSSSDGTLRAVVVPQSVAAQNVLFTLTVDGIVYRFKSDKEFTYESGKSHKFTITINHKVATGEYEFVLTNTEITPWIADPDTHGGEARQYYVAHLDEPGTLEAKIKADGKNPAKIKNLKVTGKICGLDFYFMRDKMEILQAVNLKESEIVGVFHVECHVDGEYYDLYSLEDQSDRVMEFIRETYPNSNGWGGAQWYNANEIPNGAFNGRTTLVYFAFPEVVTKIGDDAFRGTLLSGALIIPNDVAEIGSSAFYGTNITSLQLPHNIKVLGDSAFSTCSSLTGTLSLPESLESIGSNCFWGCSMLSGNLSLPSKLKEISSGCFRGCSGFTGDLIIPESVEKIGNIAFDICEGLSGRLVLPKSLKELGEQAFERCKFQGELVIPKYIQIIPTSCFQGCQFSSLIFEEGSELIKIENAAFYNNSRLCEPVVFPDGLITLSSGWNYDSGAFQGCSTLPEVVLPKGLTVIGQKAFVNCYGLSKITCNATTPPIVGTGAFNGVAKDNFTLEVPESAVAKYQTANGWSDFRRISAHYDFSISRPEMRVLNAEHSMTYLLRTPNGESAWSVESCPEWVTVSPMSGVGKTEVTITVSAMDKSEAVEFELLRDGTTSTYDKHTGRIGDVVFLLDGKDYRSTISVQQYDSDVADGQVIVNQTASKGAGVNIVFMGDCFDARDIAMGNYLDGINKAIAYYFAVEPYTTYRDYFNVYTVVGMSADSGMGTVNTIKEAKFGSQYSLEGITPDTKATYEYAMKAETVNEDNLNETLVVMVENTQDYGGICYMWGDGSAIAICPMSADAYPYDFRGIVQHEAGGHGFGKLGDEYIYHNAFIQSCDCNCCSHLQAFNEAKARGWYRNMSTDADMHTVEWSHLIFHPTYSARVDMYEGGYFHTRGIYRSESASCMNNNIPYFSAISRQAMVERIKAIAGEEFSLDDFYANDNLNAGPVAPEVQSLMVDAPMLNAASASKQMHPKYMGQKPELK
ncbi:MAG: hypothetical protein E7146_05910 [Rikenellaceae bacterium]|nr:hypothetical protein [Rikenellaceae bacterium]